MAATQSDYSAVAEAAKQASTLAKQLRSMSLELRANSSAKGLAWGNVPAEFLDADGRVIGSNVTPSDVSDAIGSLEQYELSFWAAQGGNLESLAAPIV